MGLKKIVPFLFLVGVLRYAVVDGRPQLTEDDDMKIVRQLKQLNISAAKIIKSKSGDVFDCVDINKQPSLDHPLLKNHTVQIEPSSFPKYVKDLAPSNALTHIRFEVGECPEGTVPIRRTLTSDAIMESSATNDWYAVTKAEDRKYRGGKADINVFGLSDMPYSQQSSHAIWINSGPGSPKITISAGWTVNPAKYKDSNTRLFTFWTAEGERGCYNTDCPGFIHVNKRIALSAVITPLSTYDGSQYFLPVFIFKALETGHWWFSFGKEPVGYWPKELFNNFEYAKDVQFGGWVSSPQGTKSAPMGSGHFPEEGWKRACCCTNVQIVDWKNELRELKENEQSPYFNAPDCYQVGSYLHTVPICGQYFYFGGPGGCLKTL